MCCRPTGKTLQLYALDLRLAPGVAPAPTDELELSRRLGLALLRPLPAPALQGFTSQLSSGTDVQARDRVRDGGCFG